MSSIAWPHYIVPTGSGSRPVGLLHSALPTHSHRAYPEGAGQPGTKTTPASHCYTSQACVGVEGFRGLLSASHIGTPLQSWLLCPGPACSRGPGSAQEDSPDVVLPPTWEALMELPTPGSGLAQPWLL